MNVRELIAWLGTQDPKATVEVVKHVGGRGYYDQGGTATIVEFDPSKHSDYTDFRGNRFAAGTPHANARTLLLGVKDGDFRS
jgi:hypothetical protein